MALTKTINIDGKEVTFRASAAIPRLYRVKFHRDIYKDVGLFHKLMIRFCDSLVKMKIVKIEFKG